MAAEFSQVEMKLFTVHFTSLLRSFKPTGISEPKGLLFQGSDSKWVDYFVATFRGGPCTAS